jgi:hypothetical protein
MRLILNQNAIPFDGLTNWESSFSRRQRLYERYYSGPAFAGIPHHLKDG